jgi:hypothetical protein
MSETQAKPGTAATTRRFYGKFRGTVIDNFDPQFMGRILAQVSDVGLQISSWCMPCVPFAGPQSGVFVVPPVGAGVWIEFEQGDPDYPIWVGGFWGNPGDVPEVANFPPAIPPALPFPASDPAAGQNIVIQTTGQNTLVVSDSVPTPLSGGIILQSAAGASIIVNDAGIFIDNGQGATITLLGPSVDVNNGGLTVI